MSLELSAEPANRSIPVAGVVVQRRSNEATRFRPGQSGNPSGRPRVAFLRRRTLKHLRTAIAEGVDQLDAVVDSTIQTAIAGGTPGVAAFTALRDTVDGRPAAE